MSMHRTQLLLREEQYRFLSARAREEGKSISAVLREIVDRQIKAQSTEIDPLLAIVGMAEGEDAAVGREHDRYLYGQKT